MDAFGPILRKRLSIAGRDLVLETGRMARQAGGSVLVRYGDTAVLVAATSSTRPGRHRLLPADCRL
jgi:polyribonucleotide nucleotidyltransferase